MLKIKILDRSTGKCLVEEGDKEVISSLPQLEELGFGYNLDEDGFIQFPNHEVHIEDVEEFFE